ncbi:MAG: hypothetical protein COT18_12785, partial [Elusimicrobia bacterium CG08_land_8_20_14_0_20_59_10]
CSFVAPRIRLKSEPPNASVISLRFLTLAQHLKKAGIRHYDELIHDQKKDWLLKNFKAEGAGPAYPINVARLTRNLVWQMKERVAAGPKFNLKRSFYLAEVEARHYKNQKYLVEDLPSGKKKLYGGGIRKFQNDKPGRRKRWLRNSVLRSAPGKII